MTEEATPRLTKIMLDSEKEDHFVLIDKAEIITIQAQHPVESQLHLAGENSLGVVRVFLRQVSAPFQFVRNTTAEVEALVTELSS